MTIAIGINLGDYVLLAADTRTTHYDWSGNTINYTDESEKIVKTKLGLMTGAGDLMLLDSVKERFAEEEPLDTNEIVRIIEEEISIAKSLDTNTEFTIKLVESTGWVFSYATPVESSFVFRLAVYHPSINGGLGLFLENKPAVIFPYEASEKEVLGFHEILDKFVIPLDNFDDISGAFHYYIEKFGGVISLMGSIFPSTSMDCQFGIQSIHGTWISPIIKMGEKTELTINFEGWETK